jgi:hypothetical protein
MRLISHGFFSDYMYMKQTKQKADIVQCTFKNDYVGTYGTFYKGNTYILPKELYNILKNEISEVK